MANKFSTAITKAVAGDQPWDALLKGGKFFLYSGAIPDTPEDVSLVANQVMGITLDGDTWVPMQRSTSTVTFVDINVGETIAIKIAGISIMPVFTSGSTNTITEATALALAINTSTYSLGIRAVSSGNVVTLYAPYGTGTTFDAIAVTNSGSGGTVALSGTFTGGVSGAFGIQFERDLTTKNKLVMPSADIWSGACPASVTETVSLTYFRYILDSGDDGLLDDTVSKAYRRWQGTIGGVNSSADLKFPIVSTIVATGVVLTVDSYDFTIPVS